MFSTKKTTFSFSLHLLTGPRWDCEHFTVLPRHSLVEAVPLPEGLRLALHSACTAGLHRLLNCLPGKAEQRGKGAPPGVPAARGKRPWQLLMKPCFHSDLIHTALAWNPL